MTSFQARSWVCSAIVTLAFAAGPCFCVQDTWTGVDRIVAVGDVHGDFGQFVKTLRAAQVIDGDNDWIAGKTHLVQMGDVLDRGPDSRKAMDLLMKLEEQACRTGGLVHPLIGNHEAMVLLGDWRYVIQEEEKAFGGADAYREAMSATGRYGRWIRGHNAAIRINDLVFVHGGISRACADRSLEEINQSVRDDLEKGKENGMAMDPSGPLWDRTLAVGNEDEASGHLDDVLKRFGAHRMVVGHTVSIRGILVRAGGRLIRIDVGMFSGYGGPAACLVVENGDFYEVRHPGTRRKLPLESPVRKPEAPQADPTPLRKAA
jgi:hypothetical protein